MRGTVKFFDERKNYGFIEPDEETRDRFVHASEVESGPLNKGDVVDFDPEMGDRGLKPSTSGRLSKSNQNAYSHERPDPLFYL